MEEIVLSQLDPLETAFTSAHWVYVKLSDGRGQFTLQG